MSAKSSGSGRMSRVLVTGASGFVGGALTRKLSDLSGYHVRGAFRRVPEGLSSAISGVRVGHLGPETDWRDALEDVDAVVHCAARVHQSDASCDAEAVAVAYRLANVEGTLRLAKQAVESGCRRFVFISSAKAGGGCSTAGRPLRESDAAEPVDAYGQSKLAAEQALFSLARQSSLEVVVLRPPLIYGPGVKANFHRMMRWIETGVPLPLGAVHNRRSLVALDNLCDVVERCLWHPAAAGELFYVSDDDDVSTSDLLGRIAGALGEPSRLIPVPDAWLHKLLSAVGCVDLAQRLLGTLQVDCWKARALLEWSPPVSLDTALKQTADAFKAGLHHGS